MKTNIWVFLTFLTFCRITAKCATLQHVYAKRKTINCCENLKLAPTGSRETSSIPWVIACSKMAATGELAGIKAPNLKCIFWKMFALYNILHISLDSGRDLEQFEVHML